MRNLCKLRERDGSGGGGCSKSVSSKQCLVRLEYISIRQKPETHDVRPSDSQGAVNRTAWLPAFILPGLSIRRAVMRHGVSYRGLPARWKNSSSQKTSQPFVQSTVSKLGGQLTIIGVTAYCIREGQRDRCGIFTTCPDAKYVCEEQSARWASGPPPRALQCGGTEASQ